jgi:hypothetical protein
MMPTSQNDSVGLDTAPTANFHFSPLSLPPAPSYGMSCEHHPPINEIMLRRPPVATRLATGSTFSPRTATHCMPPPPDVFRLQPRHPVKTMSSLPEAGIRKRRAHSISEATASSALPSDSDTKTGLLAEATEVTAGIYTHTPMDTPLQFKECESPARVDTTVITLEGLYLQSPQAAQTTDASPSSFAGSHQSSIRSSFNKFHASPPTFFHFAGSPMQGETPTRRPRAHSNASSMFTPKFAPLTVISHSDVAATPSSQRTLSSLRPPLYGGASTLLFSLDGTPKSDEEKDVFTPKRRPTTVLCPNFSSASSVSTMHEPSATPTSKQARTTDYESPGKRLRTPLPKLTLTPRTPLPKITLTPRSTGSRSRDSGLPRFPSPADLINKSLTPMSLFSQRFSQGAAVGSLKTSLGEPSEMGRNPSATSRDPPDSSSLALCIDSIEFAPLPVAPGPSIAKSVPATKSFIPMPDWDDAGPAVCSDTGHSESFLRTPPFLAMKTRSILAPSTSSGTLQAMMDEDERNAAADVDNDSLSDSDDDEAFVLAAPRVIDEEKQQSNHRKLRQRRCRVPGERLEPPKPITRSSVNSFDRPSCTSLFGMDFVNSSSELFGMDKSSNGNLRRTPSGYLSRDLSQSSLGLAIDGAISGSDSNDLSGRDLITPPVMDHALGMDKSSNGNLRCNPSGYLNRDLSQSSIGLAIDETISGSNSNDLSGRDLITPPFMNHAHSPPPLSPRAIFREGYI